MESGAVLDSPGRLTQANALRMHDGGNGTKIILTVPVNYNIYLNKQQRFAGVKDSIVIWHGNWMKNALRVIAPFECACLTDSGFPDCMQACEESMSVTPAWICNGSTRFLSDFRVTGNCHFVPSRHIPYKHGLR
jgi:hypothetical protein